MNASTRRLGFRRGSFLARTKRPLGMIAALAGVLATAAVCSNAAAGTPRRPEASRSETSAQKEPSAPKDHASRHFLIHTDLPAKDAQELLGRLETMLGLISAYWGRPPQGILECYVVDDLANWDTRVFPEDGLAKIRARAGVCISRTRTQGRQMFVKSTVYAVADRGVAQHEAVHAYCRQAFGRVGPIWYAEGMAEMGQYWKSGGERAVHAHPETIDYLRNTTPRSLNQLVNHTEHTGDWKDYCWWWALCHMLANNPNYGPQFRPLGLKMLMSQNIDFAQVYGPKAREIEFEYHFFLSHLCEGFRVDLCAWDWKKRFFALRTPGRNVVATVQADRGWQPSGVRVVAGTDYECTAEGTWKTAKAGPAVDADGANAVEKIDSRPAKTDSADGPGRLEAMLLNADRQLGEPFPLGRDAAFHAESDGDLYLRCRDDWGQLSDNSGKIKVKLRVKDKVTKTPVSRE